MKGAGRAVVVTGASTGIGRVTAARLSDLGFEVFAGVRRDEDAAALAALRPRRITPLPLEVTDARSVAAAAAFVAERLGPGGLRGVVNNAGIAAAAPLELLPLDDLRQVLEVNVVGAVAVTQAFLPRLREARGRVVNVGSLAGRLALPFLGGYAASKGALRSLTDALRLELRPQGIRVSLVEPGLISTSIYERVTSRAEALLAALPAPMRERYEPQMAAMRRTSEGLVHGWASPPETVARVIAQALCARRPRAHYLVGAGAHAQALMVAVLPAAVRDHVVDAVLGLTRALERENAARLAAPAVRPKRTDHA